VSNETRNRGSNTRDAAIEAVVNGNALDGAGQEALHGVILAAVATMDNKFGRDKAIEAVASAVTIGVPVPPDAHLDHFWDAIEIAVAGAIHEAITETLSSFEKADQFDIPVPDQG
jgi:hypothetical protein